MKYALADGVTLEEADGVQVFLKDNGDAAAPNRIGGVIAQQLISSGFQETIQYIIATYDVDEQTATRDIVEFANLLETRELIKKS